MTTLGKLLIIGSGIAGLSAAQAARRRYPHAQIQLISEEATGFYNRIALGAFVSGKRNHAELHTYAAHLYENERIETVFGQTISSISAADKTVSLSSGDTMPYHKLILATGASPVIPRIPGVNSQGVHYLWSLKDAEKLKQQTASAKSITIIGGGVLGIEAAMDFSAQHKEVHLVEAQSTLMAHLVKEVDAKTVAQQLGKKKIHVHTSALAQRIKPSSAGVTVELQNKTINSDLVLISIGVSPNTQLAADAGLTVKNGIVVNDTLHTSDPNILACGNCIVQPQGGALLWNPARSQGAMAGENAFEPNRSAVDNTPSSYPVHLKSDWLPLFVIGNKSDTTDAATQLKETVQPFGQKSVYLDANGQLLYAAFVGDVDGYYELEKLFYTRTALPQAAMSQTVSALIDSLRTPTDDPFTKSGWMCNVCGYTHEGEHAPDACPVCSVGRDQFLAA